MKKLIIIIIILFAPVVHADQLLDDWYEIYDKLQQKLNTEIIIEDYSYSIKMDIDAMVEYATSLTNKELVQAAAIAHEMTWGVDLPSMKAFYTEEGKRTLAKAIMTLEAEAIIEMVRQLIESDRLYV